MFWSDYNTSNNEEGLLRYNGPFREYTSDGLAFNGPFRGYTSDGLIINDPYRGYRDDDFCTGVQDSQIVEIAKSIKVGEIKIYETAEAYYNAEKEEQEETR